MAICNGIGHCYIFKYIANIPSWNMLMDSDEFPLIAW